MAIATDFAGTDREAGSRVSPGDFKHYRIVPARYPARVVGTILAAGLIIAVLQSVMTNSKWGWPVFAEWFLVRARSCRFDANAVADSACNSAGICIGNRTRACSCFTLAAAIRSFLGLYLAATIPFH